MKLKEPQPNRPRPKMPTMAAIGRYWESAEDTGDLFPRLRDRPFGWDEPCCFRCGWVPPSKGMADYSEEWKTEKVLVAVWEAAKGWLERAHLHDHFHGGDADPANLVPLCVLCHEEQPQCKTRDDGIAFVNSKCLRGELPFLAFFQMATAQLGQGKPRPSKEKALRTMLRAQAKVGEFLLAQQEASR